jgi:hypothetical protein
VYAPPPDRPAPSPWWAWPTRLALDAPAVAVVWQRYLAGAYGVPVPAAASAALGLVVWGVYLADRWFDAAPDRPADPADRHRFARRHRRGFAAGAVSALIAAVGLAGVALPSGYLAAGAAVAGGLVAYMVGTHVGGLTAGKEAAVGLLFAAGVAVPLIAAGGRGWWPAVGAFAAVCWLNCAFIDRWESDRWSAWWLPAGTAVGLGLAAGMPVAGVVGGSVLLLAGLHAAGRRVKPSARRVLADAALLTPLLL